MLAKHVDVCYHQRNTSTQAILSQLLTEDARPSVVRIARLFLNYPDLSAHDIITLNLASTDGSARVTLHRGKKLVRKIAYEIFRRDSVIPEGLE